MAKRRGKKAGGSRRGRSRVRSKKIKKRAKIQRQQTKKRARTIESLRRQVEAQEEVIRDMDRQLRVRFGQIRAQQVAGRGISVDTRKLVERGRGIHIVEEEEEVEEITVPKGATILDRDEEGNPIAWSIEDYLGAEYQEIDFDDSFWNDVYEDVGDEDEDDYPGEDE